MTILDESSEIKKIDKSGVYESIVSLPKQCTHAFKDTLNIKVPESYKNIDKIVMTGMGGSGLAARIIESVYANNLKYPLIRVNDYNLPSYADNKTLVICSSYSGTTEEIVNTARQAVDKKCKWMAIASGGTLDELAKKHKVPSYKINPVYNPSQQPRLAVGYSVIGQLMLAKSAGLVNFSKKDINKIVDVMNKVIEKNKMEVESTRNPAKKLAQKCLNKIIIYAAARHLIGVTHTVKNQLNENSKSFSASFEVPEMNHHLMEGLKYPQSNKNNLFFMFLQSKLYPGKIQQRIEITKEIVDKHKIDNYVWTAESPSMLSQAFSFIQFGALVNFYLGMLYGIDPAPIPWVDYFKKRLGQPLGQWK